VPRVCQSRPQCPEIGWGIWRVLDSDAKSVLALRYDWGERVVITAHNLSSEPCRTELASRGAADWAGLVHQFGSGDCALRRDGSLRVELEPYGSQWLRVRRATDRLQR
jgi:maltose alpha-D-glucosyltransferase/alpha-amylase